MAKINLEYDGFSSLKITQNMDSLADEFVLEMLQNYSNLEIFKPFGYTPITLNFGNLKVLTGRVMATSTKFSSDSIGITAQGISLPGVLVQSSIPSIHKENINFLHLVTFIAQKFSLKVVCDINTPNIPIAECKTGTGAFKFLNDIAKKYNLLLISNPDGDISIQSNDPDLTSAICLSETDSHGAEISVNYDSTQFARIYVASGQVGETNVYANYEYKLVPYYCIKHIQADISPKKKIEWQLIQDNIQAFSVTLKLPRWNTEDGKYFMRGQIFKMDFPSIWLKGYYRARRTNYELSNSSRSISFGLEKILENA